MRAPAPCVLPHLAAVLLREHTRKPITRTEIKDHVMLEHKAQDRTGRIFKQVLGVANEKLREIAGLELISEDAVGAAADDADDADASQLGASQSQQPAGASKQKVRGSGTARYLLVNKLPEAVSVPLHQSAPGVSIYYAFVEVVLTILSESQEKDVGSVPECSEEDLFGHLARIGLERDSKLPDPSEPDGFGADKVESLVQKRLVAEGFLRRQKKQDVDSYQYLIGARALLCRDQSAATAFVEGVKK